MAQLKNIKIQVPNKALAKILRGSEMKSLVARKGNRAKAIYQQTVAKRTGVLAGSAHVETFIGGIRNDRWFARLVADAPYAASHEFGTGRTNPANALAPAHDMIKVLESLDFGS